MSSAPEPETLGYYDGGISSNLFLNTLVAGAILVGFSVNKKISKNKQVYEPRVEDVAVVNRATPSLHLASFVRDSNSNRNSTGGKAWLQLFDWLPASLAVKDGDLLISSGLSSFLYLSFLKRLIFAFGICSLLSLLVLVPLNSSGGALKQRHLKTNNDGKEYYDFYSGFSEWTINNLADDDNKLWGHACVLLIASCVFYYIIASLAADLYFARKIIRKLTLKTRRQLQPQHSPCRELEALESEKRGEEREGEVSFVNVPECSVLISNLPRGLKNEGVRTDLYMCLSLV